MGAVIGWMIYFIGMAIPGFVDGANMVEILGFIVDGVKNFIEGAVFTLGFERMFPTFSKAAKAFAKDTRQVEPRGGFTRRVAGYTEFWVGYGLAIAFLLDLIDYVTDQNPSMNPWTHVLP